ncbi:MAG TPA: DUF1801 domain-containing protein [Planctomycetota bacterium]|jgi:hypothetical protein|nr:DUF1801 domain-containing protein [Planctomycetota bacterium]
MPSNRSPSKKHLQYHRDGTVWAKGQTLNGLATGYWEWFRKDGTRMRSGYFEDGEQVGEWTTYDQQGRVYKVTTMRRKTEAEPRRTKRRSTEHLKDRAAMRSIAAYDAAQSPVEAAVCGKVRDEIERALPDATSKVWHGSPVWFVGDTPVAGYNVTAKGGVVLLFWNGQALADRALEPIGKFKAAQTRFTEVSQLKTAPLRRWLKKAGTELWDISSVRKQRKRAT